MTARRTIEEEWAKFLMLSTEDITAEMVVFARRAMAVGAMIGMREGVHLMDEYPDDAEARKKIIDQWHAQSICMLKLPTAGAST